MFKNLFRKIFKRKSRNPDAKEIITLRSFLLEQILVTGGKITIIFIAIIAVTFSWFNRNEIIGAMNALGATAEEIKDIQISLNEGVTWSSVAVLDIGSNYSFNNEITGDGINFYKAASKTTSGNPLAFAPAIVGEDYLEFSVWFKSSTPANIYVEKKSDVYPAAGKAPDNLLNSDIVIRQSADGNFSKDLIAGAVRVAFIENDYTNGRFVPQNEPKIIWAPNSNYEVKRSGNTFVADIESTTQQDYTYMNVTNNTTFTETDLNVVETINASYANKNPNGDNYITVIDNVSEVESENIKSITVRVWIEGNDREAIYPLKGGMFNIKLSFVGISE